MLKQMQGGEADCAVVQVMLMPRACHTMPEDTKAFGLGACDCPKMELAEAATPPAATSPATANMVPRATPPPIAATLLQQHRCNTGHAAGHSLRLV